MGRGDMGIRDDDPVMPFGRYKGQNLSVIRRGYLMWLTEQDWMEKEHPDLLSWVEEEINIRDKLGEKH
jgi:uncharacterized protein (DUF3820 family)